MGGEGSYKILIIYSTTFFPFQPATKLCGQTLKSIQILLLLGASCRSSHGASHTATRLSFALNSSELRTDSGFSRLLEPPAARAPHCWIFCELSTDRKEPKGVGNGALKSKHLNSGSTPGVRAQLEGFIGAVVGRVLGAGDRVAIPLGL